MDTSKQRVNYDMIAHLYDEPERDYEADQYLVDFLMEKTDSPPPVFRILDMGCGTGKQLAATYDKFPELLMVGLDFFYGMLQQAQKRSGVINWMQGDSANLPFTNNAFDYITNQFSYHHVQDKKGMISESYRILKPGGRFVITNLDPWSMFNWIIYTFFPASKKRDLSDFLSVDSLRLLMQNTGFSNVRVTYRYKQSEENLHDFLKYATERHRTSQLLAIQDSDYEDGIARLRERVDKLGVKSCVSSEICLIWVIGDKPG